VFENRVLRKLFGPKREEVTGNWRKEVDSVSENSKSMCFIASDFINYDTTF
jgi:hypothetical protein